ncbi:MT-A70 family protein [Oxytricha trifallax]|uniref:mRNA m(6)A methyltransferase n=1 Tax=Oxytricha trifallax TaxID=1172189 RepID=A0A073HZ61_9SPIT|nr:MT-A70 family protein [Oxytricha trifallax]
MGKRHEYEIINTIVKIPCPYCQKEYDGGTSIRTHISLNHKDENKESRSLELELKKICLYCKKQFDRSYNCERHQLKCKDNHHHQTMLKKRKQTDEQMCNFKGPAIVTYRIPAGEEVYTLRQRLQKLIYKNLTKPVIYEGDVLEIKMWQQIAEDCMKANGKLYEVVIIDPPWKLKQELPYPTLTDKQILSLPMHLIQERGIIILWIVNQKKELARKFLKIHGYQEVDQGERIKLTKNGALYPGWDKYTSHCNESFLIAKKGDVKDIVQFHKAKSVIFDAVQGHSQKPTKIYDFVQTIAPDRLNIEIFAQKNNIRKGYTSVGNRLT